MSKEAKHRSTETPLLTPERAPAEIIKALSLITHTGHRPDSIFEDWLLGLIESAMTTYTEVIAPDVKEYNPLSYFLLNFLIQTGTDFALFNTRTSRNDTQKGIFGTAMFDSH